MQFWCPFKAMLSKALNINTCRSRAILKHFLKLFSFELKNVLVVFTVKYWELIPVLTNTGII